MAPLMLSLLLPLPLLLLPLVPLLPLLLLGGGGSDDGSPQCPLGVHPPCDCVQPQSNVTWQQISGTWYLIEATSPGIAREDMCFGIILSPNLKMGFEKREGEDPYYVNTTLATNVSSSWYERDLGYYTYVVFLSGDESALALVSCVPILDEYFQWIGIFNRVPNPRGEILNVVKGHLVAANITAVDKLHYYPNYGCSS